LSDHTARLQAALQDRYHIERELGRGGMAAVYLARDLRHDRHVALKVLHPELAATIGSERFLREVRMAARLQHPHILSVHDSGEAAGLLWFTMPYVEGESLRNRLQREHQLPLDDALRISHEAARALDYAHRHGVVHRDIKPENILLTNDGDTLVADFGIGRAIGTSLQDERLTETGVVVGTAAYMSPEQAAGEREIDGRSDVYSLGVVLYEMLAGEPPFTGPTTQAIIARRFTESPRPIRPIRETVPREVEEAVMRALARLPADRPATAAVFAQTLAAAGSTIPVSSATASPAAASAVRTGSRKKWIVGAAAGIAAAALIGTVLRPRGAGAPELDASLLAIAPFDVLDSKLRLWREGMVDLLSRNLDGAGPLRTVSPTVVVRRWNGRADPESAADLGRQTGAGLALYGSLLSSGKDSVRVRATLLDVRRRSTVEEWELTEAADRLDRLGDSLTFRLLRGLGRTRPVGSVRRAALGSSSLPAVKAFLQGEQHLRRSEWDSALGYYERAIRLDSTFPLALRRASIALGWIRTGYDSLSTTYALRAGAANRGLPPRDSLLVVSDSLLASLLRMGGLGIRADSSWPTQLRRLYSTLSHATALYPDDPEAWYNLGEADHHFGALTGRTYQQQLRTFDRAIALDSAYAPSYLHPIEISAMYGIPAIRRYLEPYLALQPRDVNANGIRLVARILDSLEVGGNPTPLFSRETGHGLHNAVNTLKRLPDSTEVIIALARFIAGHRWHELPLSDSVFTQRTFARSLASRGHMRAAFQALAQAQPRQSRIFPEMALLAGVPPESAATAFQQRLTEASAAELAQAFPWWASRRDTVSLRLARTHAESLAKAQSPITMVAEYVAASASAYLALARRDTANAIRQLQALPGGQCPACYLDRLTLAQLLSEQRRDREAWEILRVEHPAATLATWATEVLWSLLRGRVGERLGEHERAAAAYTWVVGMWRNADPELQPYVKEAREGLARLTAEQK
jgi:eukaryotic-like serine/threonine-protein kinase